MASGSRSPELLDWLRCGLGGVFLAAALWWQGLQLAGIRFSEISDNKVELWSSSAWVVSHATGLLTSVFFSKPPWRRSEGKAACSSST